MSYLDGDFELEGDKVDRRAIPPGESETKFITADNWNDAVQAIEDIRDAVNEGGAGGGITNSAGANVLMKSDGTNAVASQVSDDGTTVTMGAVTLLSALRGTKQTITTTGLQSITLTATTTIVEYNAAAQVDLVGMSGGSDDRIVVFRNKGAGNVFVYNDNGNEATAANRFKTDALLGATGAMLVNTNGMAIAIYDGTAQRWSFMSLIGKNTPGPLSVNGTLAVTGNSGFNGASPLAKPTVSGSRGGNAALASLITALANYGLITDGTS